ncbi:MAG: 2-C-methyl-D-erythritol 4-phosphate cytidylyltransferase [Clostridia bacterium]|nr:2-C-methyl-D-erythritol 4-phosphate cytidylyltransferase [Clostridia bacterium]
MAMVETSALNYTTAQNSEGKISVIVVCGGSSSRMNGIDKMFAEISGVPVCVRSVLAFQNCDEIDNIVVVTREENILKMQQLCEQFKLSKVTDIVVGGSCRQQSVANGVNSLCDDTGIVLIHDGARPFVTTECIKRVIEGVKNYSAVTCAVVPKDTVKMVENDGLVVSTPARDGLRAVQTPQGFDFGLYKKAIDANKDNLEDFTDDCSIVESFGYAVYTVEGDYRNIKITTADDLLIAEIFAKEEL